MLYQKYEKMTNEQILIEFQKKLEALKPLMDNSDKVECARETGISYITVHRYLNGTVRKSSVAAKIYEYLNTRLEKRTQLATA